jgi:hypothetical protein
MTAFQLLFCVIMDAREWQVVESLYLYINIHHSDNENKSLVLVNIKLFLFRIKRSPCYPLSSPVKYMLALEELIILHKSEKIRQFDIFKLFILNVGISIMFLVNRTFPILDSAYS